MAPKFVLAVLLAVGCSFAAIDMRSDDGVSVDIVYEVPVRVDRIDGVTMIETIENGTAFIVYRRGERVARYGYGVAGWKLSEEGQKDNGGSYGRQ